MFLCLNLGGIGAATLGVHQGQAVKVAQIILGGLFINGIVTSLTLGVGLNRSFSESEMRRYPLSVAARFVVRYLLGMLDPMWLFQLAVVSGLAIGFALLEQRTIFIGLPVALLFIVMTYLLAVTLLLLVGQVVQQDLGLLILSMLTVLIPLAVSFFVRLDMLNWRHVFEQVFRWSPPGLATSLLAGSGLADGIASSLAIVGWCIVPAISLWALDYIVLTGGNQKSGKISAGDYDNYYSKTARLVSPTHAPLIAKALCYYLRCNRVRMNILLALIFPVMGHYVGRNDAMQGFLFSLTFFFFAGLLSTLAIATNQFGYDEAGILRYTTLPIPLGAILRAGSTASLLIGGVLIFPAFILWELFSKTPVQAPVVALILCSSLSGLFFLNGLSLWTTVLSPLRVNFQSVIGNQLSIGGNLILWGGSFSVFGVFAILVGGLGLTALLKNWWVGVLLVVLCIGFFGLSLKWAAVALESRYERLCKVIAGADS